MIQTDFLSVSELASRWKVSERQIVEHGLHQRIPLMFLFGGLAFAPSQSFLTGHGAAIEQREAEHLRTWIASSEAHIRRNAAGKCDEFSAMDANEVLQLRASISDAEGRLTALNEELDQRDALRKKCEVFGYLRLPPRMIAELQQDGDIQFPHRAFAKDGMLMWLEPGSSGRWTERLALEDLLIPTEVVRAIEALSNQNQAPELPKPAQRQRTQEAAILSTIASLGYEPKSLPKQTPGKRWVTSEVWAVLISDKANFSSQGVFKKAWERLRQSGDIAGGS